MKSVVRSKKENLNGNFGAPRVQGHPGQLDLTKEILTKGNLRIPDRAQAFTRLEEAYNVTTDARLKAALWDMLKKRKAQVQPVIVKHERPVSEFGEYCRRVR